MCHRKSQSGDVVRSCISPILGKCYNRAPIVFTDYCMAGGIYIYCLRSFTGRIDMYYCRYSLLVSCGDQGQRLELE